MSTTVNLLEFVLQQNPMNTAVGVSLGASFTLFIAAMTEGLLIPMFILMYSLISRKRNLPDLAFNIRDIKFDIGAILKSILYLIIVLIILLYFIIEPINILNTKLGINTLSKRQCPFCKTLINNEAIVCPQCTQTLPVNWNK